MRILTEPKNALVKQYTALLSTGVELSFTPGAIEASRLRPDGQRPHREHRGAAAAHGHGKTADEVSFDAPDLRDTAVAIDEAYVTHARRHRPQRRSVTLRSLMRTARARRVGVTLMVIGLSTAACGQKGAPLAPLRLVPAPVAELSVRRVGDQARLRFVLPVRNENGPGRIELDRVEIYAMTVAPAAAAPADRELLSKTFLVGTIQVRPLPEEGEVAAEGDTRPQPGATVSFDEERTGRGP